MAYSIAIHPERKLACFCFWGTMDARQGMQAFLDYLRHPAFDPHHTMLTDSRGVVRIDSSFPDIVANVLLLLNELRRFDRPVPSIILVNRELPFVFARALDQVLEKISNIEIHVVRSEREAQLLAGCSDATFGALFRCQEQRA